MILTGMICNIIDQMIPTGMICNIIPQQNTLENDTNWHDL